MSRKSSIKEDSVSLSRFFRHQALLWVILASAGAAILATFLTGVQWYQETRNRSEWLSQTVQNVLQKNLVNGTPEQVPLDLSFLLDGQKIRGWQIFEKETSFIIYAEGLPTKEISPLFLWTFETPFQTSFPEQKRYVLRLLVANHPLFFNSLLVFLAVFGFSYILSILIIIFLERRLKSFAVKPLQSLEAHFSSAVENLEQFSYSGTVPKEFSTLNSHFNTMVKRLGDATEELVKQEKLGALGEIATRVAHDIRSPLSALQSAIEYFGHLKMPDEKGTKVLNMLELSTKRLTGIADDLLERHQGKEGGKETVFSIHHILDELIGEFEGPEQYKDVRFVKRYDSGAIHIRGDGAKLQRAFGNILKNAAEAMEFHGAITVTTKASEDRASVGIADTGPGMLEEKLQKVLAGGFTEGKEDGHGIGTKVVKETVAEHGGTLRAESTVGHGTTFFIDVPRVTQTLPVTTFTLTLNPQERVLIVDDEPSLREQWRLTLEDRGINTLLCKSYEDVVEQGISPALTPSAIIDYHFNNSEKNGVDVVKYLQSIGFTNLTLCTAEYWKPQLQRESQELGVPICPKPIPTIVIATPEQAVIANPEGVKQSRLDRHVALCAPRDDGQKNYNVLVIDDELPIRMSWELKQQMLQIGNLHCYANLEELQSNGIDLTTIDIAFVDKNIAGSQFSGAEVLRYLRKKGIPKIVIASGENNATLGADPLFAAADHILSEKIPMTLEGLV